MVEMDWIVSGKKGWVTGWLMEDVGWGERLRDSCASRPFFSGAIANPN